MGLLYLRVLSRAGPRARFFLCLESPSPPNPVPSSPIPVLSPSCPTPPGRPRVRRAPPPPPSPSSSSPRVERSVHTVVRRITTVLTEIGDLSLSRSFSSPFLPPLLSGWGSLGRVTSPRSAPRFLCAVIDIVRPPVSCIPLLPLRTSSACARYLVSERNFSHTSCTPSSSLASSTLPSRQTGSYLARGTSLYHLRHIHTYMHTHLSRAQRNIRTCQNEAPRLATNRRFDCAEALAI
ncbi:hypothetical protein BV20DRAFT_689676 [Pilatotrama ljubarskyi]|nr:hypothetical protein BV20DRAFT_689676 [Pilatotrama ljubarskyi]